MPETEGGVARAAREVSGLAAESLRIPPADVFRWEVQQLVDDLLPAWLRAYRSVDLGGRIRLELSVRVVSEKEAGDGDD